MNDDEDLWTTRKRRSILWTTAAEDHSSIRISQSMGVGQAKYNNWIMIRGKGVLKRQWIMLSLLELLRNTTIHPLLINNESHKTLLCVWEQHMVVGLDCFCS